MTNLLDMFKNKNRPWVGVDLDGTLAKYEGFVSPDHIGEPIQPMVERIKHWIESGVRVKIFTARACVPEHIPPIKRWVKHHIGVDLEVTNVKDYHMIQLWDDRAVSVGFNTGEPCFPESFEEARAPSSLRNK
jgi:hypothetical protein